MNILLQNCICESTFGTVYHDNLVEGNAYRKLFKKADKIFDKKFGNKLDSHSFKENG